MAAKVLFCLLPLVAVAAPETECAEGRTALGACQAPGRARGHMALVQIAGRLSVLEPEGSKGLDASDLDLLSDADNPLDFEDAMHSMTSQGGANANASNGTNASSGANASGNASAGGNASGNVSGGSVEGSASANSSSSASSANNASETGVAPGNASRSGRAHKGQNATNETQNATKETQNATNETQNETQNKTRGNASRSGRAHKGQNATNETQNATKETQNTTNETQNETRGNASRSGRARKGQNATNETQNATKETQNTTNETQNETQNETRGTACRTRDDSRAVAWGYTTAPPGTPCVFGRDERDEGSHCIFDDGEYGSFGWCWTNEDKDTFGSCGEGCPLFGQAKVLGKKIDSLKEELLAALKREAEEKKRAKIHSSASVGPAASSSSAGDVAN